MKKLMFLVLFLAPGIVRADPLGSLKRSSDVLLSTQAVPQDFDLKESTGNAIRLNGVTYAFPASPTLTPGTSYVFVIDASSNVTLQPAVTDAVQYSSSATYSVTITTNGVSWDSLTIPIGTLSATRATTIQSVYVYVSSGTSLTFNIDSRAAGSEGSVGTNITSGAFTATTTGASTASFSSASVAANGQLFFKTSTSASSGTVFSVTIVINFTS